MDETRGADPRVVGPYLVSALGDSAWQDSRVQLIAGGKSNLTYRVSSAAGVVVLRRPPLGHVLPTAHDMVREYTAMQALCDTAVPVPRMRALCQDPDVLGAPFYVMEEVQGLICRESLPPGYADDPARRWRIGEALVRVLGDLHRVDPDEVGLGAFGRPEGYLDRQVSRWRRQWHATRVPGILGLDELADDLASTVPASKRASIVHGDFRLDNVMLDPAVPGRIVAVLDWEMCTLGDPLADLAVLLVYWAQADDDAVRKSAAVVPSATALDGFPSRAEVASAYAERSGLDVALLPWYMGLAFMKMAVVCAGIAARAQGGAMVGDGFEGMAERIAPLVLLGRRSLAERRLL